MLDLISWRRYAYLLSAVTLAIGLVFTLATLLPNANMGLQFSIAYTGGTVWEVHFQDGTPDPADVRSVLDELGLGGEVAITTANDTEYVLIRTQALALREATVTEGSAAAAALAAQSPSPGASAGTEASASPEASASAEASAGIQAEASAGIQAEASAGIQAPVVPAASGSAVPSAEPATSLVPAATSVVPAAASAAPSPEATAASAVATAAASAEPATSFVPGAAASASAEPGAAAGASLAAGASPGPSASPEAGTGQTTIALPTEGQFGQLATTLQERFGPIDEVRQENSVGPVVSTELVWQTLVLVLMAAGAIMIWVGYRFRDIRMGVTALLALLHDVIVVVGTFAVLGTLVGLEIDALFVTAMLTVIGFSVHDTIVVFDRIRENRHRFMGEPLESIVNHSLVQTFGRSMTTSFTLVLTMLALLFFGGEAIRPFTFALLVGVISGTYSSLFVATPLFLDWHLRDDRHKAEQPVTRKAERRPA
jgi:preprotein translocase SecF subunit